MAQIGNCPWTMALHCPRCSKIGPRNCPGQLTSVGWAAAAAGCCREVFRAALQKIFWVVQRYRKESRVNVRGRAPKIPAQFRTRRRNAAREEERRERRLLIMICACGVYYFSAPFDRFITVIRSRMRDGSDLGRMRNVPRAIPPLPLSLTSLFWMWPACQLRGGVQTEINNLFYLQSISLGNQGTFVVRALHYQTPSHYMQQEWHLGRNESKPFSPPPRCNLGRSDSAGFDEVALNDFDVGPPLIETLPLSLVWIFGAKVVGAGKH